MFKTYHQSDYSGVETKHMVFNEKHAIDIAVNRVVYPKYGSFHTLDLGVLNEDTGLPLVLNSDYRLVSLDKLATERSGKGVFRGIQILNKQVVNVTIRYRFVGGEHMSGQHLIDLANDTYPNGIEPNKHFDKILHKPAQWPHKPHQHSIHDTYGYSGVIRSLNRMITKPSGAKNQVKYALNKLEQEISNLNDGLDGSVGSVENALAVAELGLRVQEGEYIFTDHPSNPSVLRGYGRWVRVTDGLLRGRNTDVPNRIDDGNMLTPAVGIPTRNCYVWKNQTTNTNPTYSLTTSTRNDPNDIGVGLDAVVKVEIAVTGIPSTAEIPYRLLDENGDIVDYSVVSEPYGMVRVGTNSVAVIEFFFYSNISEESKDRKFKLQLTNTAGIGTEFVVVDISKQKTVEIQWFANNTQTIPTTSMMSGETVFMVIKFIGEGWKTGDPLFLNWNASNIIGSELSTNLPNMVNCTSSRTTSISITVDKDATITPPNLRVNEYNYRTLVVYASPELSNVINMETYSSTLDVYDVDVLHRSSIFWYKDDVNNLITEINEGDEVGFYITSSILNDELDFEYISTKPIKYWDGLPLNLKTNTVGKTPNRVIRSVLDHLTNEGIESLTLIVKYRGKEVTRSTLLVRDTSRTPNYATWFSKTANGVAVTQVNETDDFWFNVRPLTDYVGDDPIIDIKYNLDGDPTSTKQFVLSRVKAPLHDRVIVGAKGATLEDVVYSKGGSSTTSVLSMKMHAVADGVISHDALFDVSIKPYNDPDWRVPKRLKIIDVTMPNVVATWSTSATKLTPITQVNEMQTNGLDTRVYLWLDMDGDGGRFKDITLKSNSIANVDFVNVFPQTIRLGAGTTRYIITVDIRADFDKDGDKVIHILGTHQDHNNVTTEIFKAPLTIKDNSYQTPITHEWYQSRTGSKGVPAVGFSERRPLYVKVLVEAFGAPTTIAWNIRRQRNPSGQPQFHEMSGVLDVPTNAKFVWLEINPIRDYLNDPGETFLVDFPTGRKFRSASQNNRELNISPPYQTDIVPLGNDSMPLEVELLFYSDPARKNLATTFAEGDTIYGSFRLRYPKEVMSLVLAMEKTNNEVVGNDIYLGRHGNSKIYTMDSQLQIARRYVEEQTEEDVFHYFTINTHRDRTTAARNQKFKVVAYLIPNDELGGVGTVLQANANLTAHAKTSAVISLEDTSKTASYRVIKNTPNLAEGMSGTIDLEVTNGELNDNIAIMTRGSTGFNNIAVARWEVNPLGVEKIVRNVTTTQTLSWQYALLRNKNTDPVNRQDIQFVNLTTGEVVATSYLDFTDTSKTRSFINRGWRLVGANGSETSVTTVKEGDTVCYAMNSMGGSDPYAITAELVNSRSLTYLELLDPSLVRTHQLANESTELHKWYFKVLENFRTDSGNNLRLQLKMTDTADGGTTTLTSPTLTITDTSQTRTIDSIKWFKGGVDVTGGSVDEGDTVELRVTVKGGTNPFDVTVNNSSGRDISRLDSHEYGVSKTRTSDTQVLKWVFKIKNDNLNNDVVNSRMRVAINVPTATNNGVTTSLSINDTSVATTATFEFLRGGVKVNTLREGEVFKTSARVTQPISGREYRVVLETARRVQDYTPYDETRVATATAFTVTSPNLSIVENDRTDTPAQLTIVGKVIDMYTQKVLATDTLKILDTSKNPIATNPDGTARNILICNAPSGTTHIDKINEGNSIRLLVSDSALVNTIDWTAGNYIKWKIVGDTVPSLSAVTGDIIKSGFVNNTTWSQIVAIATDRKIEGNKNIYLELYEVFPSDNNFEKLLGKSKITTIIDTSRVAPSIDRVYLARPGNLNTAITSATEGETVVLVVDATDLESSHDNPVTVTLTYTGSTAANPDFTTPLPTSLSLTLTDAINRKYRGTHNLVIKNDYIEG